MHIKPKDGVLVRDPNTLQIVKPEGITVSDHDFFWVRLVNDGDFIAEEDNAKADEGDAA